MAAGQKHPTIGALLKTFLRNLTLRIRGNKRVYFKAAPVEFLTERIYVENYRREETVPK